VPLVEFTGKERGRNLLPCFKRGPEKALRDTREENAPKGRRIHPFVGSRSEISQVSLEPIKALNA
jgi:hypothetical protein